MSRGRDCYYPDFTEGETGHRQGHSRAQHHTAWTQQSWEWDPRCHSRGSSKSYSTSHRNRKEFLCLSRLCAQRGANIHDPEPARCPREMLLNSEQRESPRDAGQCYGPTGTLRSSEMYFEKWIGTRYAELSYVLNETVQCPT